MNKYLKIALGALAGFVLIAIAAVGYMWAQRDALTQKILPAAAQYISQQLNTRVEIGSVTLGEITKEDSDISLNDLAIYDSKSNLIARAKRADVNFRLIALYDDPASAVDKITVTNAEGHITKRADGSWNFDDIKTSGTGDTDFNAIIQLVDSNLTFEGIDPAVGTIDADNINANLTFNGTKNIVATGTVDRLQTSYDHNPVDIKNINTNVRIDTVDNIKAHIKGAAFDSTLIADVAVLGSRQTFNITADHADVRDYLPFIPADKIPEGVEILDGILNNVTINVAKQGDDIKFNGRSNVANGSVLVEQTTIDHINGAANFNNKEIILSAALAANDQHADVNGSIRIDGETPYFDIKAASDHFQPSAVLAAIPVDSIASFTAQLTGTVERPLVEADIEVPTIAYNGLYADNISTHFKYFDNAVYLSNFAANTFGGRITGDIELQAADFAFNAHVKTHGVSANRLAEFVPQLQGISGFVDADLGINGISDDLDQLKVYGSATAKDIFVQNIPITRIDTSFYAETKELRLDYLSASLPNHGSIGVEGTINIGRELELNFYGGHVDLAFLNNLLPPSLANVNIARAEPQTDSILPIAYAQPLPQMISGTSDFKGTIRGSIENPAVDLKFNAIDNSQREGDHFKGMLLNQPFDSVKFSANGSLDQISVSDFALNKDGKDQWLVKGTVGLTGARNIDLQVDTASVRAEDIIDLIAPDQPLTGNFDNIIKVTGTVDNPQVVGYVHFWRGSYRGMLVNNMDGDYFIEGNTIRVQDFHVNTPMIDMDVNGTIDKLTTAMDFVVAVYDIDMRRLQGKFPEHYPVEGHGRFDGVVKGTLDAPTFDGDLTAQSLFFNGVEITNVRGDVGMDGDNILLNNLSFNEGAGTYNVHGAINYQSGTVHGASVVKNADIKNLLALSDFKTDKISGALDSNIRFGGSMLNPSLNIVGTMPNGTVGGNDVHDVVVDINLINHVAYINKFEGRQGETGYVTAEGSGALNGPLNITLKAVDLALDMFTKAAGMDTELAGTATLITKIEGTMDNPKAHADLMVNGGLKDAAFDFLRGEFDVDGNIIDVKNIIIQKTVKENVYRASAKGKVPFIALNNFDPSQLNDSEQLDLTVTLDDADLSLLPVMSDMVAWAMGKMQGSLHITGTAAHPLINGKISVLDGTTKIKTVKSLIEHMNMTLNFTGTRMTVEQFDGMIGGGKYVLTGGFGFNGFTPTDYEFKFVADKLMIDSELYDGPLTMEFALNEEKIFTGDKLPKLTGHIDFDNCQFSVPTIPESDDELPHLLLDVTINLGDKVNLYSAYLCDLKLTGSAHFGGSTHYPQSSGTISVKRGGTLNYLKTVFKITESTISFDQYRSFLPSLLFDAETKLTQAKVFLHVDGPLGKANFTLTSSPEMTQEEIIQLLTLRDAYQKGGDNELDAGDLLTLGLQMSVLSEIEGVVRKTVGIDLFTISRGSGSAFERRSESKENFEDEYNVQLGKYITDNVMLKYTRGIGGDNINRYGFQYDFDSNMGLTVERENHDFIVGLEARWKF